MRSLYIYIDLNCNNMERNAEVSVAKGVFVCKNGFSRSKKRSKNKTKTKSIYSTNLWYKSYNNLWRKIEAKLHVIRSEMFSATLKDLVTFVQSSCREKLDEIPTAVLLTGINMPDHEAQFSSLINEIKENVSPHCVSLAGQDCYNLKLFVENMVIGFLRGEGVEDLYDENQDDGDCDIKKSQCNFSVLLAWYENLYMNNSLLNYSGSGSPAKRNTSPNRKPLVVIIPDLENFNESVIQNFILIAHSYINILPFVLVVGVATSLSALHRSLPYHISSKTSIKVFSSQSSSRYLDNVLENVFLTEYCLFSLEGKVFNLFKDVFLFYDLSVTGFIKNYKYAMMEHFSQGNVWSLCSNEDAAVLLEEFSEEDFENLRRIYSFRDLVEKEISFKKRIKLLTDDNYLKKVVIDKVQILKKYIYFLHLFIRCLHILVKDLPKTPLGKQIGELYATVSSGSISDSPYFKECFQLLSFQSKDEFIAKLLVILGILENNSIRKEFSKELEEIHEHLKEYVDDLKEVTRSAENEILERRSTEIPMENSLSRKQFKENLMRMSHAEITDSFGKIRKKVLDYLQSIFEKYLTNQRSLHFHEIFFFSDMSVQQQLIGTHRSAIHSALSDPQTYLQCTCCGIEDEREILPTMPDISIAYKLHLECGKLINLYDWLQAFLSILDPTDEEDSKRSVDPELQARFTQAIVEMEYLGFIKTSRKKADHVQRLTWGG